MQFHSKSPATYFIGLQSLCTKICMKVKVQKQRKTALETAQQAIKLCEMKEFIGKLYGENRSDVTMKNLKTK